MSGEFSPKIWHIANVVSKSEPCIIVIVYYSADNREPATSEVHREVNRNTIYPILDESAKLAVKNQKMYYGVDLFDGFEWSFYHKIWVCTDQVLIGCCKL